MTPLRLGSPRLHLRLTDSTNARARVLAEQGAPHGTLVTADEQSAGRGRQGRAWVAPPRRALLCSLIIRNPPRLLPLASGLAVAEAIGPGGQLKWPNDVLLDGRKVAGILVEGRPQEDWSVVGIGINVAIRPEDFPEELRDRAGGLARSPADVEPVLEALLSALESWLAADDQKVVRAWRRRDALAGREVSWDGGSGRAAGIDDDGRLIVETDDASVALQAGEVHLS